MKKLFIVMLACAALSMGVARASEPGSSAEQGMTADVAAQAVVASTREAYLAVLARYEDAAEKDLGDATLAVTRCEFIAFFADEDMVQYVEGASDDFGACIEKLEKTSSDDPRVRVYLYEQDWDESALAQGEALLKASDAWPKDLRRRITSKLSTQLAGTDEARAGQLAVVAAELGESGQVASAVEYLAKIGDTARAVTLLERTPPLGGSWWASRRIRAALALDHPQVALDDLHRHVAQDIEVPPEVAALAYQRAGDLRTAEALLRDASGTDEGLQDARFRVAMAAKNWAAAARTVNLMDMDHFTANLERLMTLMVAAPWTLAMPSLWIAALLLVALVAVFALVPGVLLVPVHYRGVLRRLKGKVPVPLFESTGLRHAWLATAAMLIVPMVVLAVLDPGALARMLSEGGNPDGRTLLWLSLWSVVLGLVVLARPLYEFARTGSFGWTRAWRSWGSILLALVGTFTVGGLLTAVHTSTGADTSTAQVEMVATMVNSGRTPWQVASGFIVVALLVPVWEEFVFRGLLLGGMARHISFGWANLVQATLFAVIHDDAPRFFYYLTMGLLAGWLVRSTRSLAPAIVLHMLINALAFAAIR